MALLSVGGCVGGMIICRLRLATRLLAINQRLERVVGSRCSSNGGASHGWILGAVLTFEMLTRWYRQK